MSNHTLLYPKDADALKLANWVFRDGGEIHTINETLRTSKPARVWLSKCLKAGLIEKRPDWIFNNKFYYYSVLVSQ